MKVKKGKKKKKPQPASQSGEMGNESKHGKFVNDAKDGNSNPFQGWKST